jgi:hypothetical protein
MTPPQSMSKGTCTTWTRSICPQSWCRPLALHERRPIPSELPAPSHSSPTNHSQTHLRGTFLIMAHCIIHGDLLLPHVPSVIPILYRLRRKAVLPIGIFHTYIRSPQLNLNLSSSLGLLAESHTNHLADRPSRFRVPMEVPFWLNRSMPMTTSVWPSFPNRLSLPNLRVYASSFAI